MATSAVDLISSKEDLKHFEFLATNSKEIIEKQVDSYRQQHSYAGTIIGATVLFIPFFLDSLSSAFQLISVISIIPIALFISSILLMLSIFRTRPLDQAFSTKKYKDLMNKSYKEILLFEMDANSRSYTSNLRITEKGSKRYIVGVTLTTVALMCAIVLMTVNKFFKIENTPTKVQVVNISKVPGIAPQK